MEKINAAIANAYSILRSCFSLLILFATTKNKTICVRNCERNALRLNKGAIEKTDAIRAAAPQNIIGKFRGVFEKCS